MRKRTLFAGTLLLLSGCVAEIAYEPGRAYAEPDEAAAEKVEALVLQVMKKRRSCLSWEDRELLHKYGGFMLPKVLGWLEGGSGGTKARAAYLLKIMDDPDTVPYLLRALGDGDRSAAGAAEDALAAISDKANVFV